MGLPTARVQAELRCSAPGGRMAPQHYRASPTRAPPMGRPRPTSSWLSELTPRPPLCVCLCLFVGEKEGGGEHPPRCGISLRSSHDTLRCGGARTTPTRHGLQKQQSVSVSQTDGQQSNATGRRQEGQRRPGADPADSSLGAAREEATYEHAIPEASLPVF